MSALPWSDSFETGLVPPWTRNNGFTLDGTIHYGTVGTYSGLGTIATTNQGVNIEKDITPQSVVYVRTYFQLNVLPAPGCYLTVLSLYASGTRLCSLTLNRSAAGSMVMQLVYWNGTALGYQDINVAAVAGQWYFIELYAKVASGVAGEYKVWVDPDPYNPVPRASISGVNNSTYGNVTTVRLSAVSNTTTLPLKVNHDAVAVDTVYIGPSGGGVNPRINVSSTPITGIPVYIDDGAGGTLTFKGNTPSSGALVLATDSLGRALVAGVTYRVQVEPEVTA